jgi:filamentous hemagglutinin family protein
MLNRTTSFRQGSIFLLGTACWLATLPLAAIALAQNAITPDATLGDEASQVVPLSSTIDLIVDGALRDQNLFHSFEDFSIGDGNSAYFITNTDIITNIFARVTGNNLSEIQGVLGTRFFDGTAFSPTGADLFLINPNGIVFGENAALDVGGSFTATSASGVQFGDTGRFSAAAPEAPPATLSIDPSAYFFNTLQPGDIVNRSVRPDLIDGTANGLRVPDGERLTLLGGSLSIEGGGLWADGGHLELVAMGDGTTRLMPDNSLSFPEGIEWRDITLNDGAFVGSFAANGGAITLAGQNISLLGASTVIVGVAGNPSNGMGQAGDIRFQATGDLSLDDGSQITNRVLTDRSGTAGNLQITANDLEVTNGAFLSASTFGNGDAGDVILTITNTARFDGVDPSDSSSPSGAASQVNSRAVGIGGNLQLTARNLEVTNGAQLGARTSGRGNAGDVTLTIAETARFDGVNPIDGSFVSRADSQVNSGAFGRGGTLQLTARNLEVTNGAQLSASTFGQGDAGDVVVIIAETARFDGSNPFGGTSSSGARSQVNPRAVGDGGSVQLTARNLEVTNGAQLTANIFGQGDAGDVVLTIAETARFDGIDPVDGIGLSFAGSRVESGAEGTGGNLQLSARNLDVTNGAQLGASTFGQGDAGDVVLTIAETAHFDGISPWNSRFPSGAASQVAPGAVGDGGNLQLTTRNLEVTNGANLSVSTFGEIGDAGDVVLIIAETARFDGVNLMSGSPSAVVSQVAPGTRGTGGNLQLSARNLEVTNGARLSASTFGQGDAGDVVLTITQTVRFDGVNPFGGIGASGAASEVAPGAVGAGGNLQLTTRNLEVTNGAQLSTSTRGEGDAGDIALNITETARVDGVNPVNGISPSVLASISAPGAMGSGGNLQLTARNLDVANRAVLSANSRGFGNAGDITLNIADRITANDGTIATSSSFNSGGQIEITAGNILLEDDSDIQTFVLSGTGGGGNITLTADFVIALDDSDILAFADDGAGGDITLQTPAFFGQNFTLDSLIADPATLNGNNRVDINATGAVAGLVTLPDVTFVENNLNDLTANIVVTDQLLAGSCIARADNDQGSFVITGSGGLPTQPGDLSLSAYPTSEVRALSNAAEAVWHPGDRIVEPTGAFELPNGRLVLSRECEGVQGTFN